MKRMFWLALGVTVGALVVRKLSSAAEQLSPRGLSQSLRGLADAHAPTSSTRSGRARPSARPS